VLSLTSLHAVFRLINIVPGGDAGCDQSVLQKTRSRSGRKPMQRVCERFFALGSCGGDHPADLRQCIDVLINDDDLSEPIWKAAADIVGAENTFAKVRRPRVRRLCDMLKIVPGLCVVSCRHPCPLHKSILRARPRDPPVGASGWRDCGKALPLALSACRSRRT